MALPETILDAGAPRNNEGVSVPWYRHEDGTAILDYPYRRPSRADPARMVATHRQRKTKIPFSDTRRVALEYAKWVEQMQGSLTARNFADLIEHYRTAHQDAKGLGSYLSGLRDGMGRVRLNDRFAEKWAGYISRLRVEPYRQSCWAENSARVRSPATIAKYMAVCRLVLRYAYNTGVLDNMPVRQWDLPKAPARDRVLTAGEQGRLLAALQDSWLYWPVYFALRNPIRVGDLFALTWQNVDLTVPWVQFWPQKTRGRQDRPTCLVCIDDELQGYLSQPHEAQTLFPRWVNGCAAPVGEFRKTWANATATAGLSGFRVHDLRHCATKHMLDQGYTTDELMRLRIHGTAEMVKRYDTADQREIAKKRSIYDADEKQKTA